MKILPDGNMLAGEITPIEFQFPPKVTADGKKSIWKTRDKTRAAFEPIITWDGADPRSITVELTYVVSGKPWTAAKIRDISREFKRIHYGLIGSKATLHIIKMKLFNSIVGPTTGNFRVDSTAIKYSPQLVTSGDVVWPKITVITITCLLVTRIAVDGVVKLDIKNLDDLPKVDWF